MLSAGAVVFLLGPRTQIDADQDWPPLPLTSDLTAWVAEREARELQIRPDHGASLLWAGATDTRTPLSIVYLHGFSADPHEVEPLVSNLASELGANVYFPRLSGHASDDPDALGQAVAEDWLDDAANAVRVGQSMGERVVLIGTSTGATLAVWAATRDDAAEDIAALILLSPNLGIADWRAGVLLLPWGKTLAQWIDPEQCPPYTPAQAPHWTLCYPSPVLTEVAAVVDLVRSLADGSLAAPTLALYSPDDTVVKPNAVPNELGRLSAQQAIVETVDGVTSLRSHVIAGVSSPETTDMVYQRVLAFLRSIRLATPDLPE